MSSFVPDCFAADEWKTKFSKVINYFADKLTTKVYRTYKFEGIEQHGLKPLEMIRSI